MIPRAFHENEFTVWCQPHAPVSVHHTLSTLTTRRWGPWESRTVIVDEGSMPLTRRANRLRKTWRHTQQGKVPWNWTLQTPKRQIRFNFTIIKDFKLSKTQAEQLNWQLPTVLIILKSNAVWIFPAESVSDEILTTTFVMNLTVSWNHQANYSGMSCGWRKSPLYCFK